MKKSHHILFILLCLTGSAALLSGCNSAASTLLMDTGLFDKDPDFNIRQSSYAAADMLAQQGGDNINKSLPLRIGTLQDLNHPQEPSSFGQLVPGHIGARLVQLGYNVSMTPAATMEAAPTNAASAPDTASGEPQPLFAATETMATAKPAPFADVPASTAVITGHYVVAGREIMVTVQIFKPSTGRVLSVFDYAVPLNRKTKSLLWEEKEEPENTVAETEQTDQTM